MINLKFSAILIVTISSLYSCKNNTNNANSMLNEKNWIVEQQENGKVEFSNKKIEIFDTKGCTVWFKNKLEAPIIIEYDATVISKKGPYDRVSDLNCFWMANDPKSPIDFFKNSKKRNGIFNNYNELTLYYVGLGGHNNTKTRFRRYDGNLDRPLLKEYDLSDKKFLIIPNKKNHIKLIVKGDYVSYKRNNQIIFELNDKNPYSNGYFAIRTVKSHLIIENLKFRKL